MLKSVVVITGCDAKFYPFMEEALKSLFALNIDRRAEIGILDLGLSPDQLDALGAMGCLVKKPHWTLPVPAAQRIPHQLGLDARTALRDYFPGFKTYLWFDADAWAQTPDFFDDMVAGAQATGAAVIRENGSGYACDFTYNWWWFGHMMACYGPLRGARVAMKPAINIGLVALSDTAPHWRSWISHYEKMLLSRQKINMDQHAFNAAIELDRLPVSLMPARHNWICTLSRPAWDAERRLVCEPNGGGAPLSVLHLAGPDKRRLYQMPIIGGGVLETPLTYTGIQALRFGDAPLAMPRLLPRTA